MSDPDAGRYALQYFREAATLRLCLEYNQDDFLFSQAGGRIVYLVDANIVRFFIDPEGESQHAVAFQARENRDYADATALITAEFLFSRGLAGQSRSPVLIAPSHGEEVEGIVQAIRAAMPNAPPNEQRLAQDKIAQLRALTQDVDRGFKTRTDAVRELREAVPELASLLLGSDWSMTAQLSRLYQEDRIRSLALHPHVTLDVLKPDPRQCHDWTDRLVEEQRIWISGRRKMDPKRTRSVDRRRAERDAQALVQTLMLDEAAAADPDRRDTRYVMITADFVLFDAYAKWFWSQPEDPGRRFVLRLPLQYVPILNALEMPNGLGSGLLTERAKEALDSLFSNLSRVDAQYARKLSYYRTMAKPDQQILETLKALYGENPLSVSAEGLPRFRNIRRMWHECFKTGVVLNAGLLNRRKEEFRFLAERLSDDVDLRHAIYEDQRRNLDRITEAHAVISTQLQISTGLGGELSPARSTPRQAPLLADARLPHLLGNSRLRDRLDALAVDGPEILRRLDNTPPDAEVMFLAACVAHRCGHWTASAIYAQSALGFGGPRVEAAVEAALVLASATRCALTESPDSAGEIDALVAANSHITRIQSLFAERADEMAEARAVCERTALVLTWIMWRRLRPLIDVLEPPASASACGADAAAALRLLEASHPAAQPDNRDLTADVRSQLHRNILRAAILDRLASPHSASLDPAVVDHTFQALIGQADSPALCAERLMGRVLLQNASEQQAQAELAQLAAAGDDPTDVPRLEREYLNHLHERLFNPTPAELATEEPALA